MDQVTLQPAQTGVGDVRLSVQFRCGGDVEPWLAETRLRLRQSELEQLAERARDFLRALPSEVSPAS